MCSSRTRICSRNAVSALTSARVRAARAAPSGPVVPRAPVASWAVQNAGPAGIVVAGSAQPVVQPGRREPIGLVLAGNYWRKLAAGKTPMEALRCLKRRLSDVVFRQLVADANRTREAGPGGHSGATLQSSAASPTPAADSSDTSLPGPADQHLTPVG